MRHFITTQDWTRDELQTLLARARAYRRDPLGKTMDGRTIALVFFNPSLRTRTSFQVGAFHLGGQAIVLEPGGSSWPLEFADGVVMDGEAEEHVKDAAKVLSRYCDLIAVRAFPKFQSWEDDRQDKVIRAFAAHAEVPVINMETIVHPCQELALMMMLQDRLGSTDGKTFLLTWVPHPKPLNTAVANSALMIAAKFGFNVRLLIPDDAYQLDNMFMDEAAEAADLNMRAVSVTTNIETAYEGADVVYAKSWGSLEAFGDRRAEMTLRRRFDIDRFRVDTDKMALTNNAVISHCLPMRRNVKVTDAVADSPAFAAIEEAENRMHVQKSIMASLLREAAR